jgi:MoaA/NifB/PqqE/SkfB family radical SAM enzyme
MLKDQSRNDIVWLEDSPMVQEHLCGDEIPLPELLQIEVTTRCNLQCVMCAKQVNKSSIGNDLKDVALQTFDQLERVLLYASDVVLTGYGEPLLHPQIIGLVERCKTCGCHVHITSSGTLLTSKMVKRIMASGLDALNISLDAATEQVYSQIRRGNGFGRIIAGIKYLNQLKTEKGVTRPPNITELCVDQAKHHGITGIYQAGQRTGCRGSEFEPVARL